MQSSKLVVLGAGNLRCSPAVIGSLGSYYGERPLEVWLFDSREERLDLFDRLARVAFEDTTVEHRLLATTDLKEALDGADIVILALEASEDVSPLAGDIPDGARVLSLLPFECALPLPSYYRLEWPAPPTEAEERAIKFQVLRWIHREESVWGLTEPFERSPLKQWLDDPSTAELAFGTT